MEMRRYCNILSISYKDRVTNEKVRSTTKHAIGSHEDLLTTVKIRTLKWSRPRHKLLWPHKDRSPRTSGGEEKERRTEETVDRQCRGMDGETICRDTGTGTQPQQMEETAAQLVRTASR